MTKITESKKRGRKGDGSIFERKNKDGQFMEWVATTTVIYYPKRKYKSWTSKDRKNGKAIVTEAMRAYQRQAEQTGIAATGAKQTLGTYLNDWLETTVKTRRTESTYRSYRQLTDLYISPTLGAIKLTALSSQDIRRWLNGLAKQQVKRTGKNMSARTVQYSHAVLRACLNQAVDDHVITRNPAVGRSVRPTAPRREEIQPFTPTQVQTLLKAVEGHWLEAYIHLCVALPLRPAEVLGTRWSLCDLNKGTVRIVKQLQKREGTLQLTDLKTNSSKRTLHLPPSTVRALQSHREHQEEAQSKAGEAWQNSDLIFCTRHGKPLGERNVFRAYQTVLKRAGLPPQSLYALRHLSISLRILMGANVREIMDDAGHSQVSLTMGTYGHIFESARRDSANRMETFLQSITTVEPELSAAQEPNLPEVEPNLRPQLTLVEPEVRHAPLIQRRAG